MLLYFLYIAESSFDLTGMSYDQLCDLKQALNLELQSRPEANPTILEPGAYEVGKDILPGRYFLMAAMPTTSFLDNLNVYIFENRELYESEKGYYSENAYKKHELTNIAESHDLIDGEVVYFYSKRLALGKLEFTFDDVFEYKVPDGTYVPKGLYIVGQDIPEGTYRVYAGTKKAGRLSVFSSQEEMNKKSTFNSYAECELTAYPSDSDDLFETIILSSGKYVKVESDVVMKKQAKLNFEE